MAPKSQTVSSSNPLTISKETNLLTIPSETEANPRYKCFVRFLNTSYLRQSLTQNPTLYVDVFEGFWRTSMVSTLAKEDGTSFQEVNCTIGDKLFQFGENEINEALGFKVEGHDTEANDAEMVAFLDLIKYADEIDMAKLNKKHVRREWSFLFDALQKVFLCRKTGWDQISHIVVKLAYSLAYNQEINVGAIILRELAQRLGRTVRGRGNEIFYPRFLQCILNYLDANIHELEGIDQNKMAYSKSMSKVLFGSLDTRNQVDVILSVTKHMQDTFASYPLDKPIYHELSWKGKAKTEGVSKSNPSLPNPSNDPPANSTIVIREPTAPTSQKVGATKKKTKKRALAVINETVELGSENHESPLTRHSKKSKSIPTTESSQQDSDVEKWSQHRVKNSLLTQVENKGEFTQSGEHITIETPPISQGELPTSNLNPTSLSVSPLKISSEQESHSHDNLAIDQSQSTSVIEPLSSDMVHDTVLTTQEPNLVGQGMHAEAYPNDTNKNIEDSPVLTGDSMPDSPFLLDMDLPSHAHGDDVVTHPISMETTSDSTIIPRLEETHTTIPPEIDKISKIAQHLLTSNLPNSDYEAILLSHKEDFEAQQAKIVDEAQQDGNVDAWVDGKRTVKLKEALAFLREDYLTALGSNAKSLSPAEIYDAVNEVYKSQLKAMHFLEKGLQSEISTIKEETEHSLVQLRNTYLSDFPKVDGILKELRKTNQTVSSMDLSLALVTDNLKRMSTKLENQLQATINSNSMLTVLWKNQYGNKLVDEVPISDISKFDFSKIKDQSLNSFKSQQLFSKVDSLEKEVADLKSENKVLSQSLEQLNHNLDDQSNATSNILLVQQQMMTTLLRSMNLPVPGEAQDILYNSKPKGEKGKGNGVNVQNRGGVPAKQQKFKGKITEETIKPITLPSVDVINAQGQRSTVTTTYYPSTMSKDISAPQQTSSAKLVKATIITEAKLQEVANSHIYHDEAFLEFLKAIYNNAQEDSRIYRERLKENIKYFTVAVRKIKEVHLREIIMVSKDNCLWHLSFQTLDKLRPISKIA
ncbi:hypothetical protein POM88_018151 [Heracleum sosnowskyi]|uniref:Uncharacterized protein n=1 Tax=Heracleum sosnowskyi TaxID=360622 RepID=A0AAD8N040_9APIA|nr:hypothetical protein POM88_018151 [Heracleum sosnowskyi]